MAFELPPLPYERTALEPHYSGETLDFHHGKHHAAYVTNLNKLIEGTADANKDLVTLIRESHGNASKTGVFNNAAQIWNHTFFWHSMKPGGGGAPTGALKEAIDRDFGSLDGFKEAFVQAGTTQFGSGWAWLVKEGGSLKVTKTPNAETPLVGPGVPLVTCDVWEHAYYIDYRNRRPDFLKAFLDHLINWDFASENFSKA
jgi:Fe-Mn family superoxide dismutase